MEIKEFRKITYGFKLIKLKASALMPETTLISPEMMVTVNLPTPVLHRCCSCCYSANQKEKKKETAETDAQLKMKMMVMLGDGDWLERRWRMEAEEEISKSPRKKEKKRTEERKRFTWKKQGKWLLQPIILLAKMPF